MSAAAAATDASSEAKPKSKKLLFILIGVVVLALAGAGGAFFILKKNTAEHEDGAEEEAVVDAAPPPGTPPTFLPLDSMVVNLADPGGNRFVQLAITLQVQDVATSDAIKLYMPSIRNGILMLVSQLTADEILKPEGKEKLSQDIIEEVSATMGYQIDEQDEDTSKKKKRRRAPPNPLQGVLFSSFIVQ
jgi:flagellar protein FliL